MIIAKISNIQWSTPEETEKRLPKKILFHFVKVKLPQDTEILEMAENLYGQSIKEAEIKIYEVSIENVHNLPEDVREYYFNLMRGFFNLRGRVLEESIQKAPEFGVVQDLVSRDSFTFNDMVRVAQEKLHLPDYAAKIFTNKAIKVWTQLNYLEMTCNENGEFIYWVPEKD